MDATSNTSCTISTPASGSSEGQLEGSCLLEVLPLSCWSAVVDLLSAADVLRLSNSSKAVQQLLSSTPGIWCQAARNCLLTAAVPGSSFAAGSTASLLPSSSSSRHASSASPQWQQQQAVQAAATAWDGNSDKQDEAAYQMLSAFTALAHSCQHLRPQMKPQTYLLPPWLAAQPGKARGFVQLDGQSLNPSLTLSEAQVHWLSLGCLAGMHVLTSTSLALLYFRQLRVGCLQPGYAACRSRLHSAYAFRYSAAQDTTCLVKFVMPRRVRLNAGVTCVAAACRP
jgi:hypothetical protein